MFRSGGVWVLPGASTWGNSRPRFFGQGLAAEGCLILLGLLFGSSAFRMELKGLRDPTFSPERRLSCDKQT
jgi:hypothetical protein